ncbi:hypothetical protein DSM3645_12376 [Blastopirellula marina DSM 3645]|uniref:Uncharacterized protein n=1 Tax=Blastopirellula marina DSM 3645 TaxID=314230 RepID=A3ZRP5_9BACT|nr:hypothetical protein DSM3645_12376 [Blastopirellula marina DSM 3645]
MLARMMFINSPPLAFARDQVMPFYSADEMIRADGNVEST